MKIGILTFPFNYNFGNLLQSYALATYLKSLGYEPEFINFQLYKKNPKNKLTNTLKSILCFLFPKMITKKKPHFFIFRGFDLFIKRNLRPYTSPIHNQIQLNALLNKKKYKAVLVGSDQVWRRKYMGAKIYVFFLSFVPDKIKKISYAASFGVESWQFNEDESQKLKELLDRFSDISVREKSAAIQLKEKFNLNAVHLIDPTMLLDLAIYRQLIYKNSFKHPDQYLFSYLLDFDENKKTLLGNAARILSLNTIVKGSITSFEINDEIINTTNPIEFWISCVLNSDFVITDSFHGTVFSILFNKPFITVGNEERGVTRFESLLEMFGLEDRLINDEDELSVKKEFLIKEIDWDKVNLKIAQERMRAKCFLNNSILKE